MPWRQEPHYNTQPPIFGESMTRKHLYMVVIPLLATLASGHAAAADKKWRYSLGVHDFTVPDVNSDTYGINAGASMDKRTDTNRHVFVSIEAYLDRDQDRLDSEHIPVWGQLYVETDNNFWRDERLALGWIADAQTRVNTVGAIEQQLTALPALAGKYNGQYVEASLEAGAGWFYLHLDDDAPDELGYERDGLRNSTLGYAATAKLKFKLGESCTLAGMARHWWDLDNTPLEDQYQVALRADVGDRLDGHILKHTTLVLSADQYEYNLDVYNHPFPPPVLLWDNDLVFRLALESDL